MLAMRFFFTSGVLDAAVRVFDSCPLAPANLARRALDAHYDRRRGAATQDPTWAEIEARRHITGSTNTTLLSDDLTMFDWREQDRIADELTPDPSWAGAARAAKDWRARRLVNAIHHIQQRSVRGWSDADTWNMGHHIADVIAGMLDHLAEHAAGWPSNTYSSYDDWVGALATNAAALRSCYSSPESRAALDEWGRLSAIAGSEAEADAALHALRDIEEANEAAGTVAMHWVADNFHHLWD